MDDERIVARLSCGTSPRLVCCSDPPGRPTARECYRGDKLARMTDVQGEVTTLRAAELLGVSDGTVRAQINKGKLVAEKRGRDLFIRLAEVERYARENQPHRRGGRRPTRRGA